MNIVRSVAIFVLVFLIVILSLRYSFFQPFEPRAVLSSIPDYATSACKAEGIDELIISPVGRQLNESFEDDQTIESRLYANATHKMWVKKLISSEVALATLPARFPDRPKSWVVASWIGWRSSWLRWRLERTKNDRLAYLGKHAAWPIWSYTAEDLADGKTITFSITDKLFIACISAYPSDIEELLNTYDKRMPAITTAIKRNK